MSTLEQFGPIPEEDSNKKRIRIHQGWWRINVLNQECGKHPLDSNQNVCSTIKNGDQSLNNFLTDNIKKAVNSSLNNRNGSNSGLMEKERLYNNLLSSHQFALISSVNCHLIKNLA
jgi:hypothetical protein